MSNIPELVARCDDHGKRLFSSLADVLNPENMAFYAAFKQIIISEMGGRVEPFPLASIDHLLQDEEDLLASIFTDICKDFVERGYMT